MSFLTSQKQTVQVVPSKQKPLRKKKERKTRWKRGEEEKKGRKEFVRQKERKRKAKGKEKRRMRSGRERRGENRESDTRNVPPSPDTSPSTKLGDNTTPIKGRLGKNTTPTGRGPTNLNQNPQADPLRRRPSFDASFRTDSSCTPERTEDSKYGLHNNIAVIYKKAKALRNSRNRFRFSMNHN